MTRIEEKKKIKSANTKSGIKSKSAGEEKDLAENIISTLRVPLLILDKDLRVIKASRSFFNFFKLTDVETLGTFIYELGDHQWDIPKLKELLEKILPEKTSFDNFEVERKFSAIGKRTLLLNAQQIKRAAGEEQLILLVIEDVTQRKCSEKDIKTNEEEFKIITENSPDAIFIVNKQGRYQYVNTKAVQMLDYSKQELLSLAITDVVPKERVEEYVQLFRQSVQDGSSFAEIELVKKDGNKITADLNTVLLPNGFIYGSCRDITGRKLAEETQRESEKNYRELIDGMNETVWVIDFNGDIIDVNKTALEVLGYSKEELLDTGLYGIDSSLKKEDIKTLVKTMPSNKLQIFETSHKTKDGKTFPVEVYSSLVTYQGKKAILSIARNITERKQIESALKISEERFRTAAETLTDVVYEWDLKDKLDWYGDIDSIMGSQPGEFPRTIAGWEAVIHPEDTERVITALKNHIKGTAHYNTEYRVKKNNGGWRWWSARGKALRNEHGIAYKMIGSITDITEQKQAEDAISNERSLLRTIIDLIPDAIYAIDIKGRKILANAKEIELCGKNSEDEIIGKTDFDLYPVIEAQRYYEEDQIIIQSGKPALDMEDTLIGKDGQIHWLLGSKVPLRDVHGQITGIVGVNHDITRRKHIEEELTINNEQLLKLNAEKDKFFSIIAHDLKSPFSGFINLTELMADDTQEFSIAEFTENSKMLNKSAKNLFKLLENLLEWAQLQKGTIEFNPTEFELSKLVSQAIETISHRASQKLISIINEVSDSQMVFADEKMIYTVIRNLLSNALKFTRMNGTIVINSQRFDTGVIQVSVKDNGIGMTEDIVKKLFKIEEKIGSKGTDGELSTGLGLFICKEFIDMHDSKIWVASEEEKGSTFFFTLREKKLDEVE